MRGRGAILLLTLFLLPLPPARADARGDLHQALALERTGGELERALALYRRAAGANDPEVRGRARLGEGRCLRRLGRPAEARRVLDELIGSSPPAEIADEARRELGLLEREPGGPAEAPTEEDRLRAELEKARAEAKGLREQLAGAEGEKEEIERLKRELEAKDALVEKLTEKIDAAAREEESRKKEEAERAYVAAYALGQARALYREARFDEALAWVKRALEQDPRNAEARELFQRLGDPLGDREKLVLEVLRLLDAERRLRLDELRLQIDALLSKGEDQLLRGDLDESVDRFRACLALVKANPSFARDLVARRERAQTFLARAIDRGGEGTSPAPEPTPSGGEREGRWRETLRGLLEDLATSPRPGGSRLRIYDLAEIDDPTRAEPPTPGALSLSLRRPPPGDLLTRLVPLLVHPPAWREGDQFLRSQGADLVVYAPDEIQRGVAGLIQRLAAAQEEPVRVLFTCVGVDPEVLAGAAAVADAGFLAKDGAAWAVLGREAADRFREALAEAEVLGTLETLVSPGRAVGVEQLRSLALAAPEEPGAPGGIRNVEHGFRASLLASWSGDEYGVALKAEVARVAGTTALPSPRGEETQVPAVVRQDCSLAARVPPGGTLAVAGLLNPFAERPFPRRPGLLLLVRFAESRPQPREATGEVGEAAGLVPIDLDGLDIAVPDMPAPPFMGEGPRPTEGRSGFLSRYLSEAVGEGELAAPGASLTVGRGVVWAQGGEHLVERARAAVAGLLATRDRSVNVRVRAAAVAPAEEALLLRGLPPGGTVLEGEGVRVFLVDGEARGRIGYSVSGASGRIPLLSDRVEARSTQLAHVTTLHRRSYLREYRKGADGRSWPVYDSIDEGLVVEVRPVVLEEGPVDLAISARVARILDRGSAGAAEPGSPPQPPVHAVTDSRVRARLTPGDSVLLTGLPAPTPSAEGLDRLLVLITVQP